ncbi:MAG: ABC transporter permease, partial [Bifidobacteriaceae bacterium]|nr:ABC transporter permease [Bifidobacteriaceae bacterium]
MPTTVSEPPVGAAGLDFSAEALSALTAATAEASPVHEDRTPATRRVRARLAFVGVAVRLAQGALVVWAAATLTFIAVHVAPGDTIDTLLGTNANDPAMRAQVIREWGLDHPAIVQYLLYFWRCLHGDLGVSYVEHRPVASLLAEQFPPTVELTLWAFAIALALAATLALTTAGTSRIGRAISQFFELTVVSAPPFWIGMLLLAVFSFRLGLFPVSGSAGIRAVVLPALAVGLPIGCFLAQVLREGLDRALEQPFALTARARGLGRFGVKRIHALRHAALPTMTISGLTFGNLLGGAVICEQVFGRAGIGQLAVNAINTKDIPVILAIALLAAIVFVVITTTVDLLYLVVDPRLRGESRWQG